MLTKFEVIDAFAMDFAKELTLQKLSSEDSDVEQATSYFFRTYDELLTTLSVSRGLQFHPKQLEQLAMYFAKELTLQEVSSEDSNIEQQ